MKSTENTRLVRVFTALLGAALVISITALGVGVLLERWSIVVKATMVLPLLIVVLYGWMGVVREDDIFLREEEIEEEEIDNLDI